MTRPVTSQASAQPYKLKGVLMRHGIEQQDLRRRFVYAGGSRVGQEMAPTTISYLLNRRCWPVTIPRHEIEEKTAALLREHGVPEEEIASIWQTENGEGDKPDGRAAHKKPEDAPFQLPENEMLSMQAREHFGLTRHPFVDDVQGPQDVYLSKDQRYIREAMYYTAKHSGLLAVIGESGAGKTTLRRDLLDRIRRDNEPIALIQPKTIDKRVLTAAHICDAIVLDLSTEIPKLSLEAKARQVERILSASARTGNLHAMIIEEAHDLSNATLKYLKRFWELEDGFRKLIGIVLVGQPELTDKLDERKNPDLREFIRRCEIATLKSLNGNLEEYLALKFKRIGVNLEDVFEKDAFDAIRMRLTRKRMNSGEVESHLYPLVVQNLIVKAMNQAVELGLPKVGAKLVEKV